MPVLASATGAVPSRVLPLASTCAEARNLGGCRIDVGGILRDGTGKAWSFLPGCFARAGNEWILEVA